MMHDSRSNERTIFISRAGSDAALAARIADILEAAGYRAILQQRNFKRANFMKAMHDALDSGARVVALLSPDYLSSKYCQAEWMNAIADDPLNERRRLIVLRIAECVPTGLLAGIDYADLVGTLHDDPKLAATVREAVRTEDDRDSEALRFGPGSIGPVPSFTGREDELEAIDRGLLDGSLVAVHGMGGTGKSALAREYAWRRLANYSLVRLIPAETEDGIIDALIRLRAELDPSPRMIADRREDAQRVITMLRTRDAKPALLIFDNVPDERVLHEWTPGGRTRVLATSRSSAWSKTVRAIPLGLWRRIDGVTYLQEESGRADLSDDDAAAIAERLGDLPLALAHAAAYLKRTKTVDATAYLDRLQHHLGEAPKGTDYPRAVFATFREAIAQAEENAPGATAIATLASFFAPDAIPEELFHAAPDFDDAVVVRPYSDGARIPLDLSSALTDESGVSEALGELDRLSLILFRSADRTFSIHRLVQSAARGLALDQQVAWALRAVDVVLGSFPQRPYDFVAWPQCERLLAHARSALDEVPETHTGEAIWRLANRVAGYLHERAAFRDAEALFHRALYIAENLYADPHDAIATTLNNLASLLRSMKRSKEAEHLFKRCLDMKERLPDVDPTSVAVTLNNLASIYRLTEQFDEAERTLRRVKEIDEKYYGPSHPEIAVDLANLAAVVYDQGRVEEAEQMMVTALQIDTDHFGRDHPRTTAHRENFAHIVNRLGRPAEAAAILEDILPRYELTYGNAHPNVARVLWSLAALSAAAGRLKDAEAAVRRAAIIYESAYGPDDPDVIKLKRIIAERFNG